MGKERNCLNETKKLDVLNIIKPKNQAHLRIHLAICYISAAQDNRQRFFDTCARAHSYINVYVQA